MNIGCKLQKLRKEKGLSQEELASILEVSRQSVSKWESDLSYPETDKLIKICDYFNITIDSLLRHDCVEKPKIELNNEQTRKRFHYEYKSKKLLFGLPLVHVNFGVGMYVAKGIISIGNISKGFISIGYLSLGIISFGLFSLGLISLGVLAIALLLATGSIACGIIAIGAIAFGVFTIGAVSIGYFSVGALAIGKYFAYGDYANGLIAIGKTKVNGTYTFTNTTNKEQIITLIDNQIPVFWNLFKEWIKHFL